MKNQIGLTMPGIPDAATLAKTPRGGRFDLLAPPDIVLIVACADRACGLMARWRKHFPGDEVIEINPTVVQVDLAVAHLCRNLNLQAFLQANEFDFISEYTAIEKSIDRLATSVPLDVPLQFAQSGAKKT